MSCLKMFIKFVKDKTHAVHQAVHICRFTILVGRTMVRGKRRLESFKVLHPFKCKVMWLNVGFIEDEYEGKLRFVQNTTRRYVKIKDMRWNKI